MGVNYIETEDDLRAFYDEVKACEFLALDSEFHRTNTFYPQAALLQFNDGKHTFLIDPLAISDFSPIRDLLTAPDIVKVVHAASEDLLVFNQLIGVLPRPLFDTQVAASLLGHGLSVGYSNLVNDLLGVELDKGQTRSDWLQRPLSDSQLKYAEQDVVHLASIYLKLRAELSALNRLDWLYQECETALRDAEEFENYDDYYLKVKSVWQLDRKGLAILKSLCCWREQESRKRDRPRNHIVKERALFDIAKWQPKGDDELRRIKEISHRCVKQYGEILLDIVAEVSKLDADTYPLTLPKPLPPKAGTLLKSMKATVRKLASEERVPAELLVRKKEYELIVRSKHQHGEYAVPQTMTRWRRELVEEELLKMLNEL